MKKVGLCNLISIYALYKTNDQDLYDKNEILKQT